MSLQSSPNMMMKMAMTRNDSPLMKTTPSVMNWRIASESPFTLPMNCEVCLRSKYASDSRISAL